MVSDRFKYTRKSKKFTSLCVSVINFAFGPLIKCVKKLLNVVVFTCMKKKTTKIKNRKKKTEYPCENK